MPVALSLSQLSLPSLPRQAERLVELGLLSRCPSTAAADGQLLVVHPDRAPASVLTPLLQRAGKPGFVVTDMTDVDDFEPIPAVDVPEEETYLVSGIERGDE